MKCSLFFEELVDLGLSERIYCSNDEIKTYTQMNDDQIPQDVFYVDKEGNDSKGKKYWRYGNFNVPKDELIELAALRNSNNIAKNTENIETIKKCVIFFTVLTILSLIASVFIR